MDDGLSDRLDVALLLLSLLASASLWIAFVVLGPAHLLVIGVGWLVIARIAFYLIGDAQ